MIAPFWLQGSLHSPNFSVSAFVKASTQGFRRFGTGNPFFVRVGRKFIWRITNRTRPDKAKIISVFKITSLLNLKFSAEVTEDKDVFYTEVHVYIDCVRQLFSSFWSLSNFKSHHHFPSPTGTLFQELRKGASFLWWPLTIWIIDINRL